MKKDSDLALAYTFARGFWPHSAGARRKAPQEARAALMQARKILAALPGLQEQEAAARAALEAQRPIDSRKYAPAWVKAGADLETARKAAANGRAFKYAESFWRRPYVGTWQKKPGLFYVEKADSVFRNTSPAADLLTGRDIPTGFYSDPYQESLCRGFIVQLPSRKGRARFAAAYAFDESDNGSLTADLSRIFESGFEEEQRSARKQIGKAYWTPAMDSPGYWAESAHEAARKEAAAAAQGLAESAAEKERDYQTAWQAGNQWAELKERESELRQKALAILKERRAAMASGPVAFPALCWALREKIESILEKIKESREKRAELAQGDSTDLNFWPGQKDLAAAFCDGADLQAFPA